MPNVFRPWPEATVDLAIETVQEMYESGYAGAKYDPAAQEQLRAEAEVAYASDVAASHQFADEAAGKLVLAFVPVVRRYPKAWPGPAQRRGSCVMHDTRNAMLGTMVGESFLGFPDEVSGYAEECPDVSAVAEANGVLAMEPGYHYRGHRGDGWSCASAALVVVKYTGAVVRKPYPDIGVDLTKLDEQYAGKYYNRGQIPSEVAEAFNDNLFRTQTEVDGPGPCRDFLNKMFFISTCGSEGFSSQRNEHGVSSRKGSWSHAMAYIGFDDRPWAHSTYGGPLVLVLNSWGIFNSGPRDIHDSASTYEPAMRAELEQRGIVNPQTGNVMIPAGSFWARWRDVQRRYMVAFSGLNGWQRKSLPDYLGGFQ